MDSALNHSREEDELKALTCNDQHSDDQALRDDIEKIFAHSEYDGVGELKLRLDEVLGTLYLESKC